MILPVQLQGDGPLQLAVINGNNQQQLRGVARVQGDIADDADLKTMVGNGYLVITISRKEGERYQGVVGLEGDTLAACLEDYFQRSEQLPTRLIIRTGEHEGQPMAGGMLLPGDAGAGYPDDRLRAPGDAHRDHQGGRAVHPAGERCAVAPVP